MNEWSDEASPITVAGLKQLCEDLISARDKKSQLEDQVTIAEGAVREIKTRILSIMKENAMPNFKGEFGTISIRNTKSISQPEDFAHKLKFFEYLKSQGIFEEMVSVNSRTLSSWANKEIETREKAGVFGWVPPGLKPPETYSDLSVRKK